MKRITRIMGDTAPETNKRLRVAAYCRVSSDSSEQLVSLETQKSHYESYIKQNPKWELAGLYFDEGVSGTKKEKRPALINMLEDCEDGKIDFIVTKSISRFARNTADCLEMVRKLLELGIFVYFEKENINTGSMKSELVLSLLSSLAESESVSIAKNAKWGIQKRFQDGTFIIATPPYGYKNIDGKMVVEPTEAEIVKNIFAQILAGKGARAIARNLNQRKISTQKGYAWTATTIRGITRNEKYVGDVIFQKTYSDDNYFRRKNYGEKKRYLVQGHHEAIVSREVFAAANSMIKQRAKEKNATSATAKYSNRYPFSSKIVCGECGTVFKRRIHGTGKARYIAWCCYQHIEDKSKCSMLYIREDALERAFVTMLNKLIFARKHILNPLVDYLKVTNSAFRMEKISELEAKLEKNCKREEVLVSLSTKGHLDPVIFKQLNEELLEETAQLKAEKDELTDYAQGDLNHAEEANMLLEFTKKSEMLREFDAQAFTKYVERIVVRSRNEVEFRLKCGLNLKEGI